MSRSWFHLPRSTPSTLCLLSPALWGCDLQSLSSVKGFDQLKFAPPLSFNYHLLHRSWSRHHHRLSSGRPDLESCISSSVCHHQVWVVLWCSPSFAWPFGVSHESSPLWSVHFSRRLLFSGISFCFLVSLKAHPPPLFLASISPLFSMFVFVKVLSSLSKPIHASSFVIVSPCSRWWHHCSSSKGVVCSSLFATPLLVKLPSIVYLVVIQWCPQSFSNVVIGFAPL